MTRETPAELFARVRDLPIEEAVEIIRPRLIIDPPLAQSREFMMWAARYPEAIDHLCAPYRTQESGVYLPHDDGSADMIDILSIDQQTPAGAAYVGSRQMSRFGFGMMSGAAIALAFGAGVEFTLHFMPFWSAMIVCGGCAYALIRAAE